MLGNSEALVDYNQTNPLLPPPDPTLDSLRLAAEYPSSSPPGQHLAPLTDGPTGFDSDYTMMAAQCKLLFHFNNKINTNSELQYQLLSIPKISAYLNA